MKMLKFSEIITTEDQYEVAKTKASLAYYTNALISVLEGRLDKHFPGHSRKV